jgi:hypothetical protein
VLQALQVAPNLPQVLATLLVLAVRCCCCCQQGALLQVLLGLQAAPQLLVDLSAQQAKPVAPEQPTQTHLAQTVPTSQARAAVPPLLQLLQLQEQRVVPVDLCATLEAQQRLLMLPGLAAVGPGLVLGQLLL